MGSGEAVSLDADLKWMEDFDYVAGRCEVADRLTN